ncbi:MULTISPECIES: hypothetical protein [unclassified Mesorhizobium]|uniref:hypothetical protein n=1 Tax=unclassified Mesorhizobium TaxID=325217 RepID=UPI0015E2EE9F|nr:MULTISPECIES: hypothetical protein [unclassified Mesorhizobium]
MTDRQKFAALMAYVLVGAVLAHLFGDAIFDVGGEGLSVAAGLAYFGLFALVMERVG